MCAVLLPPGGNPIAVNKYIISYIKATEITSCGQCHSRWNFASGVLFNFPLQSQLQWKDFETLLIGLTFSVRHLNAIKSTAGRRFLGIKPLPALQQM
jgi:hypothetical protein